MFTNCPECGTVFRIGAAELRLAEGFVRCGTCGATFNALTFLADEPAEPHGQPPVEPEAEPRLAPADLARTAGVTANPPGTARLDAEADVAMAAPQASDAGQAAALDRNGDGAVAVVGDTLEFDVPEDRWPRFFEDTGVQLMPAMGPPLEQTATSQPDGAEEAPGATGTPRFPASDDWQELLTDGGDEDGADEGHAPVFVLGEELAPALAREADTAPWLLAPEAVAAPDRQRADLPQPWSEPAPGNDLADGGPPGTPQAPWVAQPMAWQPEPFPSEPRRSAGYAIGSIVLVLALAGQLIHYQRDELAASQTWGHAFQALYGRLGLTLYPAWNLGAYDVRGTEAVAGRTAQGALDILARISIVGTRPVGLPLVRVVLRDRWSNPLGSRVFEPAEYLGAGKHPAEPLAPGSLIPVRISLNDPGRNAYGYEVDVCIMTRTQGLQCQQEREPFRP